MVQARMWSVIRRSRRPLSRPDRTARRRPRPPPRRSAAGCRCGSSSPRPAARPPYVPGPCPCRCSCWAAAAGCPAADPTRLNWVNTRFQISTDFAEVGVIEDLAARAADAVRAFARRAGRPEVVVLAHPLDAVRRQADVPRPDPGRLVVVQVDRDGQPVRDRCPATACSVRNSQAQWIASRLK